MTVTTTPWSSPAVPNEETPPLFATAEPRLLAGQRLPVPERGLGWLIDAAAQVRLRGRGGAAFPVATKLGAVRRGARVLVNGHEGEPASWKDRVLMRHYPDLVLDGVAVVASALRSPRTVIAVSDALAAAVLTEAIRRRGLPFEIHRSSRDFVGGEIGALVNEVNGEAPRPHGRRVLPHERGLDRRPTFASNVETFAQLALLSAYGPKEYAALGHDAEPGTSLVTLHGAVPRRGAIEAPHGLALTALTGEQDTPVLVGGYHGTWVRPAGLTVGRTALREQGVGWGAGVLAVLPEQTCPLGEVARVARWLASVSAGQCGPCVFGLPAIADDLDRLATGEGVELDRLRRRLGVVAGRGACHHPTGATGFVSSALLAFASDVERHLSEGHCGRPVLGVLPLGGAW